MDYGTWTLEELLAENRRLQGIRDQAKQQQMELQPFLDIAWKNQEAEAAAQADPALTQVVGGESTNG